MLRDLLSKMYYNYRQALQAVGRLDEAAEAALARRQLWQDDSERLFGVAVELGEIGQVVRGSPDVQVVRGSPDPAHQTTAAQSLDAEVIATLRQIYENGWPQEIELATDKRFTYLHGLAAFDTLVADLNAGPTDNQDRRHDQSAR
jgi:hypothetical protein